MNNSITILSIIFKIFPDVFRVKRWENLYGELIGREGTAEAKMVMFHTGNLLDDWAIRGNRSSTSHVSYRQFAGGLGKKIRRKLI